MTLAKIVTILPSHHSTRMIEKVGVMASTMFISKMDSSNYFVTLKIDIFISDQIEEIKVLQIL